MRPDLRPALADEVPALHKGYSYLLYLMQTYEAEGYPSFGMLDDSQLELADHAAGYAVVGVSELVVEKISFIRHKIDYTLKFRKARKEKDLQALGAAASGGLTGGPQPAKLEPVKPILPPVGEKILIRF